MAVAVIEENPLVEYLDVEFVDDVEEFRCVRCNKVLFQHYISNCGHAFCANCKRVLDDGSQGWKCPRCNEYIKHIVVQNEELERKLKELRVHCPNKRYGCLFEDQLKLIPNHLKQCEFFKENCLPRLLEDNENKNMNLDQMFLINQRFCKLDAEVQEMRERIIQLESKDVEDELRLEKNLVEIKSIVNGARSDMLAETNMINHELVQMKNVDLTVEEFKSKLSEYKGQSDAIYGLLDYKEEKLNKIIAKSRLEMQNEFRANLMELRQQINADMEGKCVHESRNADNEIDELRVNLAQQTLKTDEISLIHEKEKLEIEDFKKDIKGLIEDLKMEINIGLSDVGAKLEHAK